MDNLFNFDYQVAPVRNEDGSDSRFVNMWGQGGQVVHTGKKGYKMVSTQSLSTIGNSLIDRGLAVTPYVHKHGECIGLNVKLKGNHMTAVGDKSYEAVINVPNNGTGTGKLFLREKVLICSNGMTRKLDNKTSIKIPHNMDYPMALNLAEEAIQNFVHFIEQSNLFDEGLSKEALTTEEVRYQLNRWFFFQEIPESQKQGLTFNEFREMVSLNPENGQKFMSRYRQLTSAYHRELEYNEQLGRQLSKYTVLASVTNYLSRREEASQSSAPQEVQGIRLMKKTDAVINQLVKA